MSCPTPFGPGRGLTWATGRPDAAVGYYTAALRGAAKGGEPSSAFRRLARLPGGNAMPD